MRELKFRAWDNKAKRWLSEGESVEMALITKFVPKFSLNGEMSGTIEQYTGLKDKNGKEIYEGDIVEQSLVDDPFNGNYPSYIVCWNEEFLGWGLKDVNGDDGNDTDLHFFIEKQDRIEVIGNIHETLS